MTRTHDYRWLGSLALLFSLALAAVVAFAAESPTSLEAGTLSADEADVDSPEIPPDVLVVAAAGLYPGARGEATVVITNRVGHPIRITEITSAGAATPNEAHASECTTSGVSFVNQNGLKVDVPAFGISTVYLDDAVSMSNASSDGCQGAIFEVPVSVSATEAP